MGESNVNQDKKYCFELKQKISYGWESTEYVNWNVRNTI